jgi:hypothetical protein
VNGYGTEMKIFYGFHTSIEGDIRLLMAIDSSLGKPLELFLFSDLHSYMSDTRRHLAVIVKYQSSREHPE